MVLTRSEENFHWRIGHLIVGWMDFNYAKSRMKVYFAASVLLASERADMLWREVHGIGGAILLTL